MENRFSSIVLKTKQLKAIELSYVFLIFLTYIISRFFILIHLRREYVSMLFLTRQESINLMSSYD